jgi:hypothetical protein
MYEILRGLADRWRYVRQNQLVTGMYEKRKGLASPFKPKEGLNGPQSGWLEWGTADIEKAKGAAGGCAFV